MSKTVESRDVESINLLKVQISPNFVYFQILGKNQSLEVPPKGYYLPIKNLKDAFKDFLNTTDRQKISEVEVCSRLTEKIFQTKLGGSVAQLVTAGFEDLINIRQPYVEKNLCLMPTKMDHLGTDDLTLPVNERVCADGSVLQKLDLDEMQKHVDFLQKKSVDKVVLHFIHANKNSHNLDTASRILKENGFQVFNQQPIVHTAELKTWRKNLLDACLSGVHQEMETQILSALNELEMCNTVLKYFRLNPEDSSMSSLNLGWLRQIQNQFIHENANILYLGIENWCFINAHEFEESQPTPWGDIFLPAPFFRKLQTQPGLEFLINHKNFNFQFGQDRGLDPGPIAFGRSMRMLLLDVLIYSKMWESPWITPVGLNKLKNHLEPITKGTQVKPENLMKDAMMFITKRLAVESLLFCQTPIANKKKQKVILCGNFAATFLPILKDEFSFIDWHLQGQIA